MYPWPFYDGQWYMHQQAKDVAIKVRKVRYACEGYCKMIVEYWNLGYTGNPWKIDSVKNYIVKGEQYDNWIRLSEKRMHNPRRIPGLPPEV